MYVYFGQFKMAALKVYVYKARNHVCWHFAVYLSNEIRILICVYTVILVISILKDSPVRYSSKYYEDRATAF